MVCVRRARVCWVVRAGMGMCGGAGGGVHCGVRWMMGMCVCLVLVGGQWPVTEPELALHTSLQSGKVIIVTSLQLPPSVYSRG